MLSATLLKDISLGAEASAPENYTEIGSQVYFAADNEYGRELWKTDRTSGGTQLVKDIRPGGFVSSISPGANFAEVNGVLYFVADDGASGAELWRSDGTCAGTQLVRDIQPGAIGSSPHELLNVNGLLYFVADDGSTGQELWKTDGTSAGTQLLRDAVPGAIGTNAHELTNVGGLVYFGGDSGVNGNELWRSDGTSAGTVIWANINSMPGAGSYPAELTNANGVLVFSANDAITGHELWRTTPTGVQKILDINPGATGSGIGDITPVGSRFFFRANDGVHGEELWVSDRTSGGTMLVADVSSGAMFQSPRSLANINGTLFFSHYNGSQGPELWTSDGTSTGTVMVRDIRSGGLGSYPTEITNFNGVAYFQANAGDGTAYELWRSDGTSAGTQLVQDINLSGNSSPSSLTPLSGGLLIFTADNGTVGAEPWTLSSATTLTVNGTVGNDTFQFQSLSNTTFYYQLNGVSSPAYDTTLYAGVIFNGNGGNDLGIIYDNPNASDSARFTPGSLNLVGLGYTVQINQTNTIYLFGNASDGALFDASSGSNVFYGLPGNAILSGGGSLNQSVGFGSGYFNNFAGTNDVVMLFDNAGSADNLSANPSSATLTGAGLNYYVTYAEQVYVFSGGLNDGDTSAIVGSEGNDLFYGLPFYSLLYDTGLSYFIEVIQFESISVPSGGGFDQAIFYDSDGNDTAVIDVTHGRMNGTTLSGHPYLYDTSSFDIYFALSISGVGDFDSVTVNDSSGNDVLFGQGNYGSVVFGLGLVTSTSAAMQGFNAITANSTQGGMDYATRYRDIAIDFALTLNGPWISIEY